MKLKTASILSIVVGSLSFFSGMAVLTGIREVDYFTLTTLIVYNTIAGIAALIAGFGLWRKKQWAVRLTAAIAGAHLIVITIVSFGYIQDGPVAVESLYAMMFRVVVWVVIVVLIGNRK
jgi:uncharacterized membrane protein (DUF2068 family)